MFSCQAHARSVVVSTHSFFPDIRPRALESRLSSLLFSFLYIHFHSRLRPSFLIMILHPITLPLFPYIIFSSSLSSLLIMPSMTKTKLIHLFSVRLGRRRRRTKLQRRRHRPHPLEPDPPQEDHRPCIRFLLHHHYCQEDWCKERRCHYRQERQESRF